jgi:hypothetical protein
MAKHRYDNPSGPQARGSDIGLWHLSAGLLVVGGVLDVTIGFPRLPATSGLADAAKWVGGMATTGFSTQDGLEHVVNRVSSAWSGLSALSLPPLPTIVDVELFLRSPSNAQFDAVGAVLSWAAWLVWLWLLLTTLLRVLVVLGERAGIGVEWLGRLRAVSDRVTLALVRQAVDATLAGGMFLRAVAPAPQPITPPMI